MMDKNSNNNLVDRDVSGEQQKPFSASGNTSNRAIGVNNGFNVAANQHQVSGPDNLARGTGRIHNPMQMPNSGKKSKPTNTSKYDTLDDKKGLEDKNDSLNNTKDNKAQQRNPLPGTVNSKRKPDSQTNQNQKKPTSNQDENNKNKLGKKVPAPKTGFGKAALALSRLRSRRNENQSGGEVETEEQQSAISDLIGIIPIGNPVVKTILLIAGPAIPILLLILAVTIIAALIPTFTATSSTTCDQPSYAVNSSDATEFLCNMQSPFKDDGYIVTGVSGWRFDPNNGDIRFHAGTDVVGSGNNNQVIYAVADGTVEKAGVDGGYGNSVLIDHNGNFKTRYAHMSSISVSAKSEVHVGDPIGIQGSTGKSTGTHLHFEILDSNGKYLSANPFFGYSDQGYEECINPDKSVSSSSACVKSDTPTARKIGSEGFAQICGRTNAYTTNSSTNNECCGIAVNTTTSSSLIDFIGVFEGGVGKSYQCRTQDGQDGYLVYNHGDKNTVGAGVTTDYLPGITVNQCVAKSTVEEGMNKAISAKRSTIKSVFANANLNQHQEDAMTSMAYNGCGTYFSGIAKAAESNNLSGVWSAMKGCTNSGTLGLQRRRKAEFALYVTGDYSVAESYKSKTWSSTEYDDYDSEGVMAKKMSGTSANYCSPTSSTSNAASGTREKVIEIATKELNAWNNYSSTNQYCSAVKKYINACGLGEQVADYCAGFITYVLKEAGVFNSLEISGNTCQVRDFEKSSKVTVHDAGGSYTPKPGDLFVKVGTKKAGYPDWAHIGFVERVEGKNIHSIEGNTDPFEGFCNQVADKGDGTIRRKTHKESSTDITHYYEIKYEGE